MMVVVPARAGVIPGGHGRTPESEGRPRASGGHPASTRSSSSTPASSPRERGSSGQEVRGGGVVNVVPARAGVIPNHMSCAARTRSRPRASGGHPVSAYSSGPMVLSSPRERGSSCFRAEAAAGGAVVPARAGVIHPMPGQYAGPSRRPRASGGHPAMYARSRRKEASSPRERGSSGLLPQQFEVVVVVPARAGVIHTGTSYVGWSASRPRASGGHPPAGLGSSEVFTSSPCERGSSLPGWLLVWTPDVVPARAGVIPVPRAYVRVPVGRPRASGGHPGSCVITGPTKESSPRERGSSPVRHRVRPGVAVVPARAGVIPSR